MRQGRRVIRGLGALLVAGLLLSTLPAGPVVAAPMVSTCADSGAGSLRAAITAAVAGDTITFGVNCPSGAGTQITLTSGTLTIAQNNLTIDASGHTIVVDGNNAVTVFKINTGVTASIKGLTIQHGHGSQGGGGGHCVSGGCGGGIYNSGTLTVMNSTLTTNLTSGEGEGGGIFNDGTLMVMNSMLTSNTVTLFAGGGIENFGGTLTVADSTISGNAAAVSGQGGGINSTGGPLVLTNSAILGNTNDGIRSNTGGTLTVANSTISGNTGVGIGGNSLTVINSTISGNAFSGISGSLTAANALIAGNNTGGGAGGSPDVGGTFQGSSKNNLIGDGTGSSGITSGVNGNIVGTAASPIKALLGPLGTYGSANGTQTLALLPGSPAIDAGDDVTCAAALPTGAGGSDQRGVLRTVNGVHCDIGAFESHGFTMMLMGGNNQTTGIGTAFLQPLAVMVTAKAAGGPFSEPVTGGQVTITGPAGGAGIQSSPLVGTIAGGGQASVTVTANCTPGAYQVTESASGANTVPFSLTNAPAAGCASPSGLQFYPLAKPVRLLDTRVGATALVMPNAPLTAGQTLPLPGQFSYNGVTIPLTAQAIVGNATVANGSNGTPAGFATLFPSGVPQPLTSNLNFVPGTVRPNNFTVALGGDTKFNLFSSSGGDFVIDISGYYAPAGAGGLYFHPLSAPVRELDTRAGAAAFMHPSATLTANQTLNLPGSFAFSSITVPASAKALVGNATVANSANGTPAGFATLYPNGVPLPLASNLNFVPGTVAPNAFTVALGGDGTYNLYSSTGGDFVIDITGYLDTTAAGGLLFTPLSAPVRELDTRAGATADVTPGATLTAGQTLPLPGSFTFAGITVPVAAQALVGNATVANDGNATPAGFATLYPDGVPLPLASNLNFVAKQVAPNAVVVGVGGDGKYDLYTSSGGDFIIDISGYFAAPGGAATKPATTPAKATVPTATPTTTKPTG